MATEELGELSNCPVKEVWEHEALSFTPWLAKNLDRLSAILGVELELEGTEVPVRTYKADIVCRNPEDGSRIVIENQLGRANSQHLGQLLTYAAGLDAEIAVWIAREFREVHLDALRWLNKQTPQRLQFFAVRISVVQICHPEIVASPCAPVFEVIERPEEGSRIGMFRRDFWAHLAERIPDFPRLPAGYKGSNFRHRVDEHKVFIRQYIESDGVGLSLEGYVDESNESMLDRLGFMLQPLRESLEQASDKDDPGQINDETFQGGTEAKHPCSIRLDIDTRNRNNWDQIANWLDDRRRIYERILREYAPDPEQSGAGAQHSESG